MRDDYFKEALAIIGDPYVLVSMISGRVQMFRHGRRPLVETLEALSLEDIALREIIAGQITYILGDIVVQENPAAPERPATGGSNPPISPMVAAPGQALALG
jgi:DNA-directed RNA polymerase subunit omega